jgi:dTDP-4-amino-4,6-dideoxygalactose transaminase
MTVAHGRLLAIEGAAPTVAATEHRPWPEINDDDRRAITGVLDRGELWGAHGTEVTALNEEYAAATGTAFAHAVNSGTAALHCALVGSGVGPGDEVIVPALSFVATPMSVLHAGATPIFCDVDPVSFNLDAAQAEKLITERTRAILPVHAHGLPADMDALDVVAAQYGLAVVEDAAQAHGALYRGRRAGTLGVAAAFSLSGPKNLSAGEGGLVTTDDPEIYRAIRRLSIFGEDAVPVGPGELRAFWSRGLGWNYRIHEITAAFARSQLRRLDGWNARARSNAARLTAGLSAINGLTPPSVPVGVESTYFRYRIMLRPEEFGWAGSDTEFRDRVLSALRAEGVAASVWHLHPLPAQPVFRRDNYAAWRPGLDDRPTKPWDPGAFPHAAWVLDRSIVLGGAPLQVQTASLMDRYLEAFAKVFDRMDVVLSAAYEPLRPVPPIPSHELSGAPTR